MFPRRRAGLCRSGVVSDPQGKVWFLGLMLTRVCIGFVVVSAGLAGCGLPYDTSDRYQRGLVLVLTGVEGRSPLNENICHGLNDGGVNWAIELVDWTVHVPGAYLVNLRNQARNRRKAEEIAQRVVRYQMAFPHNPVVLVGQSGGGAMAVWAAEALPPGAKVDGLVLVSVSLSPGYRLDVALERSRRGIVSFCSRRDWVMLGAGTTVWGTMDGQHSPAAGRVGFQRPAEGRPALLYQRLFEIPWTAAMSECWPGGQHLTAGSRGFAERYLAPFVLAQRWDEWTVQRILAEPGAVQPADPMRLR